MSPSFWSFRCSAGSFTVKDVDWCGLATSRSTSSARSFGDISITFVVVICSGSDNRLRFRLSRFLGAWFLVFAFSSTLISSF